jgi:hypothetical protein
VCPFNRRDERSSPAEQDIVPLGVFAGVGAEGADFAPPVDPKKAVGFT